jgi:ABC-type branched-subunit amino acid transport system ATPase component
MSRDAILELDRVSKHFGGLNVVDDLSFAVRRGSRTALIGPNGAGKTTVFNLISGVFPVDAGAIRLQDSEITRIPSRLRIRHGIARTFQNVRLMPHLSTLENVIVGQHSRAGWRGVLQPVNLVPRNRWREEARAALADAGLADFASASVGSLPYGVQKRIEVVRALMAKPALLLLDEPAAGLNPAETEALQLYLERLSSKDGLTLLIVEHDMHFVGALCGDVVVLSFGRKIAEGSPEAVRQNPEVQEVYLGTPAARANATEAPARLECDRAACSA